MIFYWKWDECIEFMDKTFLIWKYIIMEWELPLLSICIAAYNVENYIVECLDSIKFYEKDYDNKEIIIVNDCSNDNTEVLIKNWILKNKEINVIYFENKKNCWCSWTYHLASKLANWKYITFLDADDFLIKKSFLSKVKMFNKIPELKIVYGNCYTYNNKLWFVSDFQWDLKIRFWNSLDDSRFFLNTKNPKCSISTAVIDLDFFRSIWWFDPLIQINDWVLNIKIFNNIKSLNEIAFNKIPCFAYRINDFNMTRNIDNMLKQQLLVIDNYVDDKYKLMSYSNIYYEASLWYLRSSKYKKAFLSLKKSLSYFSSFRRLFIFFLYFFIPLRFIELIPDSVKKKVLLLLWL